MDDIISILHIFSEYTEIAIQHGFMIIFASTAPFAPILVYLNNLLEYKQDAKNYSKYFRRPVPIHTNAIYIWMKILSVMNWLSIITNVSKKFLMDIAIENKQ